jgi:hypothetical protein
MYINGFELVLDKLAGSNRQWLFIHRSYTLIIDFLKESKQKLIKEDVKIVTIPFEATEYILTICDVFKILIRLKIFLP